MNENTNLIDEHNEGLTPIETLSPFKRMVLSLGTLPSAFYDKMTYYESLVYFYEYLKNEVIPTVNNNGEAVEELQTKYLELKDYVDNYFDNLDVQEEINAKLDEMATDGTLTNLIKNYVDPIYQAYEESINETVSNIDDKVDDLDSNMATFKEIINSQISYIDNKVSAVTSGSPKGVYATVSDLTTADPDHDDIYVVTADGKWYYYNTSTSSWTAGGTYLGEPNPNTDLVVDQFLISQNLYNPANDTIGYQIDSSGNVVESSNHMYNLTDYIYIGSGNTVTFKNWGGTLSTIGVQAYGVYNSNKVFGARFQTATNQDSTTYTMPSGFDYIRLNVFGYNTPNYYEFSVNLGDELLDYLPYAYITIKNKVLPKVIRVDKNNFNGFTSINSAIQNANAGDTILIYPGEYTEIIEAWNKEIHLVGIDKSSTIIKNATGTYSTPPIEIGAGSLENLTIIAEQGTSTDPNGWKDYAVHVEDNNLHNKKLIITNCDLISYNAPAIGIGLRSGCEVTIENCNLIGKTNNGGSLFFHDSNIDGYVGIQNINIINCNMISEGTAEPTLKVSSMDKTGATVNIRYINNNVYNTNGINYEISTNNSDGTPSGGSYTGNPWRNLTNFNLTPDSYGNRKTGMNY